MTVELDQTARKAFASEIEQLAGEFRGVFGFETIVPEVLFVCVQNAGRSQIAAGLLDKLADGRVHVRTAGSEPSDEINPVVIDALAEVGVDISQEFPKPLTDEFVRAADAVVTMGCGDACPVYRGKRYEDWELEDPEGKDLETVRRIRDEIGQRVQALLDRLVDDDSA